MLLVTPMLIGFAAAKSPASDPRMVLLLANTGAVPARVLHQAEFSAAAVLARAGVRLEMVDCTIEACAAIAGFWIEFVDRIPKGRHAETAGYAVLYPAAEGIDGYAVVAWRPVEEGAVRQNLEAGLLLGATIAHEIGHLLLGKDAHSMNGVMAPRFRRREMEMMARGELRFMDDQVKRIRARLGR
jgi:hypothetical protein